VRLKAERNLEIRYAIAQECVTAVLEQEVIWLVVGIHDERVADRCVRMDVDVAEYRGATVGELVDAGCVVEGGPAVRDDLLSTVDAEETVDDVLVVVVGVLVYGCDVELTVGLLASVLAGRDERLGVDETADGSVEVDRVASDGEVSVVGLEIGRAGR